MSDANDDPPLPDPGAPRNRHAGAHAAGDRVGMKYRLLRTLGEGGMGQVWVAHNHALDIEVAVKLIRRDLVDPQAAQRLLQEARAAAKLGHPGIVRMMDCGTSDGDPYIVMELLDGESLGALLERKKRLSPARAVRTLLPVMSALSVAHQKGIVHRDLKPDNVMLCKEASGTVQPKLVDFGIAKLRDGKGASITKTGMLVGSPAYMSPEQARGEHDVDAPTDIWAMSVLLYEAITGQLPFDGDNQTVLLVAIMTREPRAPSELGVDDQGLWPLIARGLKKTPHERWPSMTAFGEALARWAVSKGVRDDVTGGSLEALWLGQHVVSDAELADAAVAARRNAEALLSSPPQAPAAPGAVDSLPPPAGPPAARPASAVPPSSRPAEAPVAPPALAGSLAPTAPASAPNKAGSGTAMIVGLVLITAVALVALVAKLL